ncbi:hypothetical protein TRVL_06085 [Trypanosoma vivax]|nr:hypothetical protein TRVL_06085 [Trypanosoma vivax]
MNMFDFHFEHRGEMSRTVERTDYHMALHNKACFRKKGVAFTSRVARARDVQNLVAIGYRYRHCREATWLGERAMDEEGPLFKANTFYSKRDRQGRCAATMETLLFFDVADGRCIRHGRNNICWRCTVRRKNNIETTERRLPILSGAVKATWKN